MTDFVGTIQPSEEVVMNTTSIWERPDLRANNGDRTNKIEVQPEAFSPEPMLVDSLQAQVAPKRRMPYKAVGANLKLQYRVTLQLGAILALGMAVALFRMPLQVDMTFEVPMLEQEVVQLEEIQQTKQEIKAPAPPRPPVPIEVPNDQVLTDEELDLDVTLDFDEELVDLGPPELPVPEEEETQTEREIFVVVEQMPEMIGGIARLYELVEYPEIAQKANLEGTVVVTFVIEPDGVPSEITVLKSIHKILDEAAVEGVKQLRFTPGMQRGKAVPVRMAIPIRFRLN